jgi:hypothetical protein
VLACVIELCEVEPRVWRRLLIPGGVRLAKIHRIFQAAVGWEDRHLHAFEIGDERYGLRFDEYPEGELDETSVTLVGALRGRERFTYEYDLGGS